MQKREVNICVFDWTWHLFHFLWMVQHLVFWREPLSHLHSLPGVLARSENLVFLEALFWIKQLSVGFQKAASSQVVPTPKSMCQLFHSLLFISEVFHSLLHTGFGMVNRLKALSRIVFTTVCLSPSLSISLLFQVSERKGRGMWSHESCGVCNSCEGGTHINSVYMLVGYSGLNSNCFFTRLHSYLASPAGVDDFSCGRAARRSGWGLRDALEQSALTALAWPWPLAGIGLTRLNKEHCFVCNC